MLGMDTIGGFVGSTSSSGGTGGSFSASVSPTDVSKTGSSRGASGTKTTSPVTVTATGGAGGYSYSWARTSGDAAITATAPTAAVTAFTAFLAPDDWFTATFVCTVTDAAGAVVHTETVTATLSLVFIDIGGSL